MESPFSPQSPSLGFTYSQIPYPLILPSYQWHL